MLNRLDNFYQTIIWHFCHIFSFGATSWEIAHKEPIGHPQENPRLVIHWALKVKFYAKHVLIYSRKRYLLFSMRVFNFKSPGIKLSSFGLRKNKTLISLKMNSRRSEIHGIRPYLFKPPVIWCSTWSKLVLRTFNFWPGRPPKVAPGRWRPEQ